MTSDCVHVRAVCVLVTGTNSWTGQTKGLTVTGEEQKLVEKEEELQRMQTDDGVSMEQLVQQQAAVKQQQQKLKAVRDARADQGKGGRYLYISCVCKHYWCRQCAHVCAGLCFVDMCVRMCAM